MPYKPVDDIPDIDVKKLNLRKTSAKMDDLIQTVRLALNHRYCFKTRFDYEDELRTSLIHSLLIYKTTHQSIRIIFRHVVSKKDYPPVIDAASLVREQIEKIYSIALILSNPHKWIKQGLRAAWRAEYEGYLLKMEEGRHIPRISEFLNSDYAKYLKKGQREQTHPPKIKPEVIVSDFARKVLTYNFSNPGGPNPSWFKTKKSAKKGLIKKGNIRNYIINYFDFPTPGKSIRRIPGKEMQQFLWRWHKEYSHFSQYTHIAFEKSIIPYFAEYKHLAAVEKTRIVSHKLIDKAAYTSFIATASACTLIISELKDDYGAKHLLKEFWQILRDGSLLARSLWDMYPSKVLE